jgi:hypothetical protein
MHSSLLGGLPCSKQVPSNVRVGRISSVTSQITRQEKFAMSLHSNPSRKMMSSTLVSPRAAVEEATLPDHGDSDAAVLANLRIVVFSGKRYVHDFLEGPLCQVFPKATFVEVRYSSTTMRPVQHMAWHHTAVLCCTPHDIQHQSCTAAHDAVQHHSSHHAVSG